MLVSLPRLLIPLLSSFGNVERYPSFQTASIKWRLKDLQRAQGQLRLVQTLQRRVSEKQSDHVDGDGHASLRNLAETLAVKPLFPCYVNRSVAEQAVICYI